MEEKNQFTEKVAAIFKGNTFKRYLFFWLSFIVGYIVPCVYFIVKLGITKQATTIVMPTLLVIVAVVIKLCASIPEWVATWKPSFAKGLIKGIPVFLLFIMLMTLGFTLKALAKAQLDIAFTMYFEVVLVLFGSLTASAFIEALHLKYKELDLIDKGYVLGVVNK